MWLYFFFYGFMLIYMIILWVRNLLVTLIMLLLLILGFEFNAGTLCCSNISWASLKGFIASELHNLVYLQEL